MRKYFLAIGISISIFINAIFGGRPYQTFCARSYEDKKNGKFNLVFILDFFLGKDHCMMDWVWWKVSIAKINDEIKKGE